jgi:predicted aspartyl protease
MFRITFEVGDPTGTRYEPIEALVDTGAPYTVIPAPILERLGIRRETTETFEFADGRTIELDLGQTAVRVAGRTVITLVVFAEPETQPLLGAYTLQGVRLAADPGAPAPRSRPAAAPRRHRVVASSRARRAAAAKRLRLP